jgi:hypothetical protein
VLKHACGSKHSSEVRDWGGERDFANHHCVQMLQGSEPDNNFLGYEIRFYGREILLASLNEVPVRI